MNEQAVRLDQVDDATRRLLKAAGALTDEDIGAPSLLPGWTRGHVLNHVARNADALRNLLSWARTGVVTPAYPSQQARDDAIEAGAARPAAELAADITRTAAEFGAEAATLDRRAWEVRVHLLDGREFPDGAGPDPTAGRGRTASHRPGLRLPASRLAGRLRGHGPAGTGPVPARRPALTFRSGGRNDQI